MLFPRRTPFLIALFLTATLSAWAGQHVVVEAAHGGTDSGSRAPGQTEKSWNLKFAQALAKALDEAALPDDVHRTLKDFFANTATFLMNRPE